MDGTTYLCGSVLERLMLFRYQGILTNSKLSWSDHIAVMCSTARKILALVYEQF